MDIEELFNRRFGEKAKENNAKMLRKRVDYSNVRDSNYLDSLILLILGVISATLMFLYSYKLWICLLALGFYICAVILYYTIRPRKCKTCKSKMHRFENNDDVLFCCDNCKTKFKCIVRLGNDG